MHIAIVDDNRKDREQLEKMLKQYCALHKLHLFISNYSSGDDLLEDFEPGKYQCMFLDIYMDGTDGMETARKIYALDPLCKLIFSTISISHAVSSYEVHAAWYLTKPFSMKRLSDAMEAACKDIALENASISIFSNGMKLNIPLNEIYYTDCLNRKARIHMKERILEINESISELIGKLSSDERFLLCNRNTLVNMDLVDRIAENAFCLKNGARVPLRQRGRTSLKKAFLDWTLRELRREY